MGRVECTVQVGLRGEQFALEYLLQRGLRLQTRNWRWGRWELDLVMEDEVCLRVVEVRTRTAPVQIPPSVTVTRKKQRFLAKAAAAYVRRYGIRKEVVFDVVGVVLEKDQVMIEYVPDAFFPIG